MPGPTTLLLFGEPRLAHGETGDETSRANDRDSNRKTGRSSYVNGDEISRVSDRESTRRTGRGATWAIDGDSTRRTRGTAGRANHDESSHRTGGAVGWANDDESSRRPSGEAGREAGGPGAREIPAGGKRLIAYAALHRCRLDRRQTAGTLWPSCDDVRAAGNLRSALWRLRAAGLTVLESDKRQIWLHSAVTVDADQVAAWALRLIDGGPASDRDEATWHRSRPGLLPGWPDEWVGPYRERLRQRVLHAMEARASALLTAGDLERALAAARLLTAAEPQRATAHRLLAAITQAAPAR